MSDKEKMWERGNRAAWRALLGTCLGSLYAQNEDLSKERLIAEREDIVAQLRQLCDRHGDNDWDATDHLGDVIDKHLGRYLGR